MAAASTCTGPCREGAGGRQEAIRQPHSPCSICSSAGASYWSNPLAGSGVKPQVIQSLEVGLLGKSRATKAENECTKARDKPAHCFPKCVSLPLYPPPAQYLIPGRALNPFPRPGCSFHIPALNLTLEILPGEEGLFPQLAFHSSGRALVYFALIIYLLAWLPLSGNHVSPEGNGCFIHDAWNGTCHMEGHINIC